MSGTASMNEVEARKAEHLRLAASEEYESWAGPVWDEVQLVHQALPV